MLGRSIIGGFVFAAVVSAAAGDSTLADAVQRGDREAVRRLGFSPASTLADALEMASDVVGRDPSITHLHTPPLLIAEVQ